MHPRSTRLRFKLLWSVTHNFFILFCAIISNSNNNPKPTMNANPNASRVGLYGGANDPRVIKAEEDVAKLFDAPVIDESAIQAAMERLRVAIERRDLVMRMKARGGRSVSNGGNGQNGILW